MYMYHPEPPCYLDDSQENLFLLFLILFLFFLLRLLAQLVWIHVVLHDTLYYRIWIYCVVREQKACICLASKDGTPALITNIGIS